MTRDELENTVIDFMDTHTTLTLAASVEDIPWAADVYYARQGFDLVFFSSPRSRHSTLFETNPRAAATIHGEYQRWQDIRGLQMAGRVEQISSPLALARATATYLTQYPFVREFLTNPVSISVETVQKMTRMALYTFRPESITYVDNSKGFGTRWTLSLVDGRPRDRETERPSNRE